MPARDKTYDTPLVIIELELKLSEIDVFRSSKLRSRKNKCESNNVRCKNTVFRENILYLFDIWEF